MRLLARPQPGVTPSVPPGTIRLADGALLHVPPGVGELAPLAVMFHGAGSTASAGLALLSGVADTVVLAPQSIAATWDAIHGGFGPDVALLDEALATVFATCPIDPERVALGGFSDGASYALSLGLANGDVITHILAFSPGFVAGAAPVGRPRIFITHGTEDRVLPIDRCSRRLVLRLRDAGYDVAYEEFDGGHTLPPALARRGVDWLMGRTR